MTAIQKARHRQCVGISDARLMSAADNIRLIATTLDAQAVIFIVLVVIARGVADVVLAWR